jgi:dihydrofolate reductase
MKKTRSALSLRSKSEGHTLPSRKIARAGGARFFRELIALGLADRTRTTNHQPERSEG